MLFVVGIPRIHSEERKKGLCFEQKVIFFKKSKVRILCKKKTSEPSFLEVWRQLATERVGKIDNFFWLSVVTLVFGILRLKSENVFHKMAGMWPFGHTHAPNSQFFLRVALILCWAWVMESKIYPLALPKGTEKLCELCSKRAYLQCPKCRVTFYWWVWAVLTLFSVKRSVIRR